VSLGLPIARAIATRCDNKTKCNFLAAVQLAATVIWLNGRQILIHSPIRYTDETQQVFVRPISFLLTLSIAIPTAVPTWAEPLQIHGTTGYISEFELSGSVSERDLNGKKEFSGPLTVKHVGLCTHDGPQETVGEIRFELGQSSSRVTATLEFDGNKCTYKGMLSESYQGFMDCGRRGSLPLKLWTK
jgi:hypothetical protein